MALFLLNVYSFPESSRALYNLAEGYRLTGNDRKAVAAFEQYLKVEPDDTGVKEKIRILKIN